MPEDSRLITEEDKTITVPLNNENVLLRGMSLRNTQETLGVVIYTGHETKIQMNTIKSGYKISKMMHLVGRAIFWIFILQLVFSFSGAVICAQWSKDNLDNPYLALTKGSENMAQQDIGYLVTIMTGSWILIFCNFVPISLLVTLEMVKFWQGAFMDYDIDMYDED